MEVQVFHALVQKLCEEQLLADTRVVLVEEQIDILLLASVAM